MRFISFEVNDVLIRTKGSAGVLTAAVRSTAVRDGVEIKTCARQLANLSKENERITISHFQSTDIARSQPLDDVGVIGSHFLQTQRFRK